MAFLEISLIVFGLSDKSRIFAVAPLEVTLIVFGLSDKNRILAVALLEVSLILSGLSDKKWDFRRGVSSGKFDHFLDCQTKMGESLWRSVTYD